MKYLRSGRAVYVVIRFKALVGDVVVRPARDVDKFEITLHFFRHPFQEAVELLANILLESSSLPSPHFLYLRICLSCKGERICPAAPKGMRVDSINWYSLCYGVLEGRCCQFQTSTDVFPTDIITRTVLEKGRQKGFTIRIVFS
jgi:hypothetical protein